MWVWDVGMGIHLVEMDERGRVTLPAEVRKLLRGRVFTVEFVNPYTLVLRVASREDFAREIESIKLRGDLRRRGGDASKAKHRYGGVKV